jgi:uncharacterized cupin superfamily protein
MERTELGLVPGGEGWFVVNARETMWVDNPPFGSFTPLAGWPERWPDLGFNIGVLQPGEPMCLYHSESVREVFLVLSGEATLLIEGEERPLRKWDFVHCGPGTEHVIIGAGDSPAVVLAASVREPGSSVLYPRSKLAAEYGASADEDTTDPAAAYARFPGLAPRAYRDGDLP